jgi:hypothetical protein
VRCSGIRTLALSFLSKYVRLDVSIGTTVSELAIYLALDLRFSSLNAIIILLTLII